MDLALKITPEAISFSIYRAVGRKQSSLIDTRKFQVKSVIDEGVTETSK